MLTQNTVCQADPRFWVVMQTVKDYWVEDDVAGIGIYDAEAAESVFEGELENLVDWLKENFEVIVKCEYDNGFLEIVCEDENEYFIDDISEIRGFLEEYDAGRYSICNYREREEIAQNTMFLTLRECKKHIKANQHHYNKTAHPYAMTAWRSPQVERLYKILQNVNWDELLEE
ncbi:hypothetical protein [Clostridium magnum]|uniref:hypothetical protein n=1 Tax=Clostridium magnum TaxID=33954 RepID=UPI000919EBCB|nr:hypothetical protein [Clostridium magnum]SHJ14013.1 hypothetical protein SAMN02745944_05430 [Clostridium magnum DSM 2767]